MERKACKWLENRCYFFGQHAPTDQTSFRWVPCQLDLLYRLRTPGAIQRALISLPPNLDKSYKDILGRINGEEDGQLTQQILQIVAFNFRPLTLLGVCKILQIRSELRTFDETKRLNHPKDILDICGSLLTYDEEPEIITVAHYSVKTYLMSDLRDDDAYFQLNEEAQWPHTVGVSFALTPFQATQWRHCSKPRLCTREKISSTMRYSTELLIRKESETWASHYGVSSSHSSSARLMEGRTPKHGSDFCFQKVHLPRTLHCSTMPLHLFSLPWCSIY